MSELTQEQYDGLPDYAKEAFAQDGEKWIPAKDAKLKSTLDNLDKQYKTAEQRAQELEGKLSEYTSKEAERQKEAEKAAFEKMKKDGKIDEILEDQRKRFEAEKAELTERMTKTQQAIVNKAVGSIAADLSAEIATDKGRALVKKEIASRVQYDPEQDKYTFLSEDGSATSLDLAGFKADLLKSDTLSPLIKAQFSSGGGAEGGTGKNAGSAGTKTMTRSQFDAASDKQRMEFAKAGGKVISD